MLTRTLVTILFVQGFVIGSAHAYFQDFDGLASGDLLTTLPGWDVADMDGNPASESALSHASNSVSSSGANSAGFAGCCNRVRVNLSDAAVLGFAPSSGQVSVKYKFYYTAIDGSVKMFVNGVGSSGADVDTNQIFRTAPYQEPPPSSPLGSEAGGGWVSMSPIPPTPGNEWNSIEYLVDLDAGTTVYTFNGVSSGPYNHTAVGDFGYVILRPIDDGVGASYIDDLSITIPEPSVMGLLMGGVLLAFGRRNRSR